MAKYLLTGATGFIGGRLARQLVAAGHEIVALVRAPERAADLAALGVELRRGDVTDRASLRGPMAGVDGVYHVAGWYKVGVRDRARPRRSTSRGRATSSRRPASSACRRLSTPARSRSSATRTAGWSTRATAPAARG